MERKGMQSYNHSYTIWLGLDILRGKRMAGSASFGAWVRQRRKALGLTRQALADRVVCALITIEKIEIGERRPSDEIAQSLATALRIPPTERETFVAFARGNVQSLDSREPPLHLIPNNLPAELPALIGRETEVDHISRCLTQGNDHLLTLVGPGGVGKTVLAMHVAERFAASESLPFHDGILFVDLSPIRDADLIVAAIGNALDALRNDLGTATSEATLTVLQARLGERSMLIVLDNFEQVLPAAHKVSALLAECRNVRILVTSRERLHAQGEQVIQIEPLSPAAAVALFITCAQAANAHFRPAGTDLTTIESICRRMDGLPLAIELIAARVKLMSPPALLERLAGEHLRLGLVADGAGSLPARQRTLREAIAWSYRLLSPQEQVIFCRLGVFAGSFDLAAAEQTVADPHSRLNAEQQVVSIWNTLASLIDKCLLVERPSDGEEPRFALLETIREYAQEQLAAEGAHETIERHARYFLSLALQAQPALNGPTPQAWLRRLERELGNLRAALAWHAQHDAPALLRMCVALGALWHTTGLWREGQRLLETALEGMQGDALVRAGALYWLGRLARSMNQPDAALQHAEASVTIYRACGDERNLARAMMALGWARYSSAGCQAAMQCFEEGLALFRSLGETRGIAQALLDLSHMAREQNADYERATRQFHESHTLFRLLGDEEGMGYAIWGLALIAGEHGNIARSHELYLEALDNFKRLGAKGVVASGYENLGETSYLLGNWPAAEEELTTALQLYREVGNIAGEAMAQHHLSRLRRRQGRLADAMALLAQALNVFCRLHKAGMVARCIAAIGGIALECQQLERATQLLSAAQCCFNSQPPFLAPADVAEYEHDIAACRAGLGDDAFNRAWAAGQTMTLEEACGLALSP